MMEIHTSFRTHGNFSNISKTSKNETQPLIFSARPRVEQLPFLNNLKLVRKLLVALKNQKLRNSLYVVSQGSEQREREDGELLKHEKAKLSVMDLISEEGKFQELSNTIKSNLNKQSQTISPIIMDKKSPFKQETNQFNLSEAIDQQLKEKQPEEINKKGPKFQPIQKPTVMTRKNYLASELNKLGHELQQTYFEVEELEKIFSTLCNYYADNRKIVEANLKRKEEKDLLKEKLQQFQHKIMKNKQKQIQLKDHQEDFGLTCRKITKRYLQELIPYNRQIDLLTKQVNFPQIQRTTDKEEIMEQFFGEIEQKDEQKQLQINLKFTKVRGQLEKIKLEKKSSQQNKNMQKKNKIQSQQSNTFNKLYVSEIYSL